MSATGSGPIALYNHTQQWPLLVLLLVALVLLLFLLLVTLVLLLFLLLVALVLLLLVLLARVLRGLGLGGLRRVSSRDSVYGVLWWGNRLDGWPLQGVLHAQS